jgi:hypothetical protein
LIELEDVEGADCKITLDVRSGRFEIPDDDAQLAQRWQFDSIV